MTLISSISGIRGTIGGKPGQNLTPLDVVKFTTAFAIWVKKQDNGRKIVIGRDGRISGSIVSRLVSATLQASGLDVIDIGLSTTPTVEMAVTEEQAAGGIIITASHNPKQWNALKLLNNKGEFISAEQGEFILQQSEKEAEYADITELGTYEQKEGYLDFHIQKVLSLPLVNKEVISKKKWRIVLDAVNSTGGIAVPKLLHALGIDDIIELNCIPNGHFAHNPEPLAENLTALCAEVVKSKAHLGIAVDPDVDRLVFVSDDGNLFGEEYTLVAVADYVLQHKKGPTVSNLSSTRALRDITEKNGCRHYASAVGEVNVVEMMKEVGAVIGGEGNGGVIYPELHYGRDALVGIALFLSHLADKGKNAAFLRNSYPNYFMSKLKYDLDSKVNLDKVLKDIQKRYKKQPSLTIDGLKIEFDDSWVHLRKSNTEPIIRIYSESTSQMTADHIAAKIMADIKEIVSGKG